MNDVPETEPIFLGEETLKASDIDTIDNTARKNMLELELPLGSSRAVGDREID